VNLPDLRLHIESVTDMDLERATAVGRAYDADPELRPTRVGGDPARIKVESTLEDLIRRTGLPIGWLTVRVNTRDTYEGGEMAMSPGRGRYSGRVDRDPPTFVLVPHTISHGVLRTWADAEPGRVDRIARLFERLCEAMDACYGVAMRVPRKRFLPPGDVGLGEIGWVNYFGPAFLERWPALASTGLQTTPIGNGGVVIRIASAPWDLDESMRQPVLDAIGPDALLTDWGPDTPRGVHVPSYEDHMRFSPGTMEMPWVKGEEERASARAAVTRERSYARARKRRLAAAEGAAVTEVPRTAEWSASFDADDWRSFGRRAFRRLGEGLAGPLGRALLEEIAAAPVQLEESVAVMTDVGAVEVRWFIDDVDTVDIYFFGTDEMRALVDRVHEQWSAG
jgi:hypothetical protein